MPILSSINMSSHDISNYPFIYSPFMTSSWWSENVDRFVNEFSIVCNAFCTLNCNDDDIIGVFSLLAGVLELGNVIFDDVETQEGKVAVIRDVAQVNRISSLLSIAPEPLIQLLTKRVMITRGETFVINLNSSDANNARNAFARYVFDTVFTFIVNLTNTCLSTGSSNLQNLKSIGVLDIFGFESFKNNEFEQLLINFANEVLQYTFNTKIFQNELRLYQEEKIHVNLTLDMCPNNLSCIELISSRTQPSILSLLLSTGQSPKPSDELFCESLHKSITNYEKYFLHVHPKDKKKNFIIKHFAGEVKYTVTEKGIDNWIKKNNDDIPEGSTSLLLQSSNNAIVKVFSTVSGMGNGNNTKKGGLRKATIGDMFSVSINNLQQKLTNSMCSFIRCIKPNTTMTPLNFNSTYTLEQIRCLGIVQSCEVMKVGLSSRLPFSVLKSTLGTYVSDMEHLFREESDVVFIASLLYALDVPEDSYKLGTTRVFFKNGQLAVVNRLLNTEFDPLHLKSKMEQALEIRKQSKGIVQRLTTAAQELDAIISSKNADIMALQGHIDDALDDLIPYHNASRFANEALDTVMSNFTEKSRNVDSIYSYGKDISELPEYKQVVDIMSNTTELLQSADIMWKDLQEKYIVAEAFYSSGRPQSIKDVASDLFESLQDIRQSMQSIYDHIEEASLESSRCHLDQVKMIASLCEFSIGTIRQRLDDIATSMSNGRNLTSTIRIEANENIEKLREIVLIANNAIQIGDQIQNVCNEGRNKIDELRDKIARDEVERQAMLAKAREREEQERLEREQIEIAAIAAAAAAEVSRHVYTDSLRHFLISVCICKGKSFSRI